MLILKIFWSFVANFLIIVLKAFWLFTGALIEGSAGFLETIISEFFQSLLAGLGKVNQRGFPGHFSDWIHRTALRESYKIFIGKKRTVPRWLILTGHYSLLSFLAPDNYPDNNYPDNYKEPVRNSYKIQVRKNKDEFWQILKMSIYICVFLI